MLSPDQFPAPTGKAFDPQSGKPANFKGYADSGDPMYRVPGTKVEYQWTQLHPNRGKKNVRRGI
jgi:hypothetical protein